MAAVLGLVAVAGAVGWWRRPAPMPVERVEAAPGPLVVIDAGHGGVDGGTQGFGVLEKHVALATAVEVASELRRRGVRVVMTRETDVAMNLDARVDFVNAQAPEALVSIHFNFSTASAAIRGVETYYSDPKDLSGQTAVAAILGVASDDRAVADASVRLADAIRTRVAERASTPDRGSRNRPELAVTRRTRCPAVLVECAYLSNREDAARASRQEWRAQLAQGIADGVMAWRQAGHSTRTSDQ